MRLLEVIGKAFEADPAGASMLVDEAVSNWMLDEAEAHAPALQSHIASVVAIRNAVAKRALAKSYVEVMVGGNYPDDEVHKHAQWLAGIDAYTKAVLEGPVTKAFGRRKQETWHLSDGSPVSRVVSRDGAGKFTRYVSGGASSSVMGLGSKEQLSPHLAGSVIDTKTMTYKEGVSEDQKAKADKHQAQWEQAKRYAEELEQAYGSSHRSGVKADFHILRSDGSHRIEPVDLKTISDSDTWNIGNINPLEDQILSVTVSGGTGKTEQDAVQRFNTLGAVGDTSLARFGGAPSTDWTAALGRGDVNASAASRFFTRLQGGGNVLAAVPGGEKYGNFAALVGQLGPEAERTLGPHVRQAAYRYRGTEKSPDRELAGAFTGQEMRAVRSQADNPTIMSKDPITGAPQRQAARITDVFGKPKSEGESPITGSARYRAQSGVEGDQLKMEVASDVAAQHLVSTLPMESITAELSEKSGHVLPSQGVLFNHRGELVSQAVGFADDHYLPFNLKNLSDLRGGQYVRTRVSGGLTGEDIYASVNAGARMATVVSGSGVYSLELDPSFRGARGNSDKARSMYQRYLKILDAVDASGLYLQDITGPEKAAVHQHVQLLLPKAKPGSTEYEAELERALDAKRREKMNGINLEELWGTAQNQANEELAGRSSSGQQLARRTEDIYNEMRDAAYEEKGVQKLTLNAAGYAVALQTLQQQFPYYIRKVGYEPLPGFLKSRGLPTRAGSVRSRARTQDTGYVRPGGLRPESARSGFYETGTSGELPGKESKKPGREAPAPAGQQGKEPAAGEAGGTSSAAASPATPSGGAAETPIGDALGLLKQKAADDSKAAQDALRGTLSGLTKSDDRTYEGKSYDTVRGLDKQSRAHFLFTAGADELARLVVAEPSAAEAMMDAKAVAGALDKVYSADLEDNLKMRNEDGPAVAGGAMTREALTAWITTQAQTLADAASLTNPFDTVSNPMANTGKPQLYDELKSITSGASFKARASSDLASWKKDADEMFPTPPGRSYMSAAEMRAVVTPSLELLNKIGSPETMERMRKKLQSEPGSFNLATLATATNTTKPADIETVMGESYAQGLPSDWEARVARRAEKLQKAWAMKMTERAMELLDGGGVNPKAGTEGQFLRPQVAKASSSPRVRVLALEHPLSKALRRARSTPLG